ncbi:MAG: TlpA family protein disulfide reductase [Bryobacterales bacterium]|nr:TlpA family protein disulfide reductase [Bryobacterales bacterium]
MMNRILTLVLAAAFFISLPLGAVDQNSNRRAPGWALPDQNFKFHDLMDFRGKVVLIEFMQTSCPHCQDSTVNLKRLLARYGQNVVLIHIVNPPSSMQDVKNYIAKNLLTSPVLFDSGQVAASYLQLSPSNPSFDTPHLFVIDPQGKIVNDYEWSNATKNIFTGDGLVPTLDRLVKQIPKSR